MTPCSMCGGERSFDLYAAAPTCDHCDRICPLPRGCDRCSGASKRGPQ